MQCPQCNEIHTLGVIDSRLKKGAIYRRRACRACGFRFSTMELPMSLYDDLQRDRQTVAHLREALCS
ncbi:NrdR family transcriptional regulator [Acidithiobacillus ferriphilus]|uniref:NrdR family transcriptional regulator n=1 Tax=Acidithiobacillus ferriphilus TaxID=1689834 RepID=UPI003F79435F